MFIRTLFSFFLIAICLNSFSQQQSDNSMLNVPQQFLDRISRKFQNVEAELSGRSARMLKQMKKEEQRINKKLAKLDSAKAAKIFQEGRNEFGKLKKSLQTPKAFKVYVPHFDSLATTLSFLDLHRDIVSQGNELSGKLKQALDKVSGLKRELQKASDLRSFLKERKAYLKEQLDKLGLGKELKRINKKVYYYFQQVKEYKDLLNDPGKLEKKVIELLSKTKLFQDFIRKNSMLASLFRIPGNDPLSTSVLAGLQTRAMLTSLIDRQIAAGGPNAVQVVQSNIQAAQAQLDQLKNKLIKPGNAGLDGEDLGFKANTQKTKSFFDRLEYGTDFQTQKGSNFFPVTSDIGLSLGYKLNDKSIIGIGGSYRIGWGRGWNDIRISHQGVGVRSYINWKLKGSFHLYGGYEQNYKSAFHDFDQLKEKSAWQKSGLIGLNKVIPIKTKFIKKTSIRILWDFLSYEQVPRTQPIVFRMGWGF